MFANNSGIYLQIMVQRTIYEHSSQTLNHQELVHTISEYFSSLVFIIK